jgi:hypothetical protein
MDHLLGAQLQQILANLQCRFFQALNPFRPGHSVPAEECSKFLALQLKRSFRQWRIFRHLSARCDDISAWSVFRQSIFSTMLYFSFVHPYNFRHWRKNF